MNSELEIKTERITAMLGREGLDGVVLNAQHNFAWLTGGGSNGIDLSRENGVASLLVAADGRRFVIANSIEMPRMLAEEVSADAFEAVTIGWQDEKGSASLVVDTARSLLGTDAKIATDIPIAPATTAIESKIAGCRYQMTPDEIARFRLLGADAAATVTHVIGSLIPGETEIEIAEKLRHELALGGMASVVTLVAADNRISQFRHPVPTLNRWISKLLLVTCAKRHGLIVSLSRIVCIGEVSKELIQKTNAAANVNAALLDATRPGATGAELYATAASAYLEQGYGVEIDRHHQGGAAGYRTREWTAHPQSREIVQPHQAFAWNPSITGTKVEETCITTGDGVEIITASANFPRIETVINGRQYFSPGILSI